MANDAEQEVIREPHRFAQVLTAQQAISVFRQAKTDRQYGQVNRKLPIWTHINNVLQICTRLDSLVFAILLSQLSTERRSEVVERAQRWPGPIAEHVFEGRDRVIPVPGASAQMAYDLATKMRFSC